MEYAGSPFELKTLTDSGQIEGLLAGFGDPDLYGDVLTPGCLTRTLAARTTPLPALLFHDTHRPCGAWKRWEERADGLYVSGNLALATHDGREAHELVKAGALTGLSIGWLPKQATTDQRDGTRLVTEADLLEGSLVSVPAHPRTQITAIKGLAGPGDIADLLQAKGVAGRTAREAGGALWARIIEQSDAAALEADLAAMAEAKAATGRGEAKAMEEIQRLFDEHSARLAAPGGNSKWK